MKRGKFITVEGIEGVGKTSNIDVLVSHIESAGYEVITTREPGGTPLAEDIRGFVLDRADEPIPEIAEVLLVFAARSLNINAVIEPALQAGKCVVSDRFTDSSRAYQGAGRGLPLAMIDQLADWVHGDTQPDLTILLDAPVEVCRQRASNRSAPDRIEREDPEFFDRVRNGYLKLAENEPDRFAVVDTTQTLSAVKAAVIALADDLIRDNSH